VSGEGALGEDDIDRMVRRVIEGSVRKAVARLEEPHVVLIENRSLKMREAVGPLADEHEALILLGELTEHYADFIADRTVVLDMVVVRCD
jgi:3-phosphoglycerate kinase